MGCKKDGEVWKEYRDQFPVAENLIWLHHAGVSPLCLPASNAMKGLTDDLEKWASFHFYNWMKVYDSFRVEAAHLIGATPEEIAVVKNTSEGISFVQQGIDWKTGDRIVAFEEEFPANYLPWKFLEKQGVDVKWLSIYDPLEKIDQACQGARLLAISFVNYLSGYRMDLEAIGEICKRRGVFFLVDAIQGLGVFSVDVEKCHIDALSADGHKWLLGPEGCGILYIRKDRQDEVQPKEIGWMNVAEFHDFGSRETTLRPNAARYECGTLNTVGIYGLEAALRFIREVGINRIGEQVLDLTERLARGVERKGYRLFREWDRTAASGIVSFQKDGVDARVVVNQLKDEKIQAAPRQGWLRFSPHFYQNADEMDRVLERLP